MNEIDQEKEDVPQENFVTAPTNKRVVAFGMDYILLGLCSFLIFLYLPRLMGEQVAEEFANLISQLQDSFQQTNPDQERMRQLLEETGRFYQKMNFDFIIFNFYMLYFFVGEIFFGGKSIGKATFSICSRTNEGHKQLNMFQMVVRSFLKSLYCTYALIFWIINLCIFFYNRRCLHDILTKTSSFRAV